MNEDNQLCSCLSFYIHGEKTFWNLGSIIPDQEKKALTSSSFIDYNKRKKPVPSRLSFSKSSFYEKKHSITYKLFFLVFWNRFLLVQAISFIDSKKYSHDRIRNISFFLITVSLYYHHQRGVIIKWKMVTKT